MLGKSMPFPQTPLRCLIASMLIFTLHTSAWANAGAPKMSFEISFPREVRSEPVTGRPILMISRTNQPEVRLQLSELLPTFGTDVSGLRPSQSAFIDSHTLGSPARSLDDIPPGDYYVQAVLSVTRSFIAQMAMLSGPIWISGKDRHPTSHRVTCTANLSRCIWMPRRGTRYDCD